MPMVFPSSPTVGQVFSSGGRSWVWTGSTWDSPSSATAALNGMASIVPASVIVSSGSASVAADGTVSYTDVGSITLDNVFTSSFRHYRILMDFSSTNSGTDLNQQWRKNGTTQTSTIYNWGYSYLALGTWTVATGLTQTFGVFFKDLFNGAGNTVSYDIWSPNDALNRSSWSGIFRRARNVGIATAGTNVNDNVDGIHLVLTAGTITGTMKIYGYN